MQEMSAVRISVHNQQLSQPLRKMKKPIKANKVKILRAMRELIASKKINLLQIDHVHHKMLAKQLKIPERNIKKTINETQPTVLLRKLL